MRVTSNSSYQTLIRDLQLISERMQKAQGEISSGKKLQKPSDDPADMSDVLRIQVDQSQIAQYMDNVAVGKTRLNFADTILQGVDQMVGRVRSLALLAEGSSTNATQNVAEVAGLRDQMLSTANSTFDGQFIFAGSATTTPAYAKQGDGSVTYQGNADVLKLQIGHASTLQTQIPGNEIFSGSVDIFATMKDLIDAMNSGDQSAIQAQVTKLESFSGIVNNALSKVGGLVNVATTIESDLTQYNLGRTAVRARLEDADLTTSITNFTQSQNALQAATAVGARISQISILDYLG